MTLSAETVSKSFTDPRHGRTQAVRDVSLTVGEGEIVGLVGESGSGKTTLITCLMRLTRPDSGAIRYRRGPTDLDVVRARGADLRRFRREVQLVFQDPYVSLNPRMTVEQLVGEGLVIHKLARSATERRDRVVATLDLVGLPSTILARHPRSFSGGQRQRIAIARALAIGPTVLVCDEPVASLDVSVQAQVVNLLRDMRERLGLSILFVAHDLAVVHNLCERVVVLHRGTVVEEGWTDAVFAAPASPHTRDLLDAVPTPDPATERTRRLARLSGAGG